MQLSVTKSTMHKYATPPQKKSPNKQTKKTFTHKVSYPQSCEKPVLLLPDFIVVVVRTLVALVHFSSSNKSEC